MKTKTLLALVLTTLFSISGNALAASISGTVSFEGTVPEGEAVNMGADPVCLMNHADGETVKLINVNEAGGLKDVFVYVKEGVTETFTAPKEPVMFDQKGCWYEPHVFGVQTNQPIQIVNSDDTLHNVHALAKTNKEFNIGMPIKGMKLKKKFTKPEVMVKIKCEVHPWMAAYVGVVDHPYYGVSGMDGTFSINELPAGTYTLEAWHESLGTATKEVTIGGADETAEVSFQFQTA